MPQVLQKRRSRPAAARSRTAPAARDAGWTMRRMGGLQVLTADSLAALPWLAHGFSTRPGGASLLNGARVLNLGFTNWDSRQVVTQNRGKFLRAIGAADMPLVALRQIHSDLARVFDGTAGAPKLQAPGEPSTNQLLKGDAVITDQAGLLASVQTADCVPILLVDRAQRVVAAVHAGWRGTLARIVEKSLGRMQFEFGTKPRDVIAVLGPAIGRCCYEVGPEVAIAFGSQFAEAADWFDGPFERLAGGDEPNPLPWLNMMPPGHQPPPPSVQLDLRVANRWQLTAAGVLPKNITVSTLCTACRTDLFFSYRREGPSDGGPRTDWPGTGRMMAAVGVRAKSR
jgi:polyphenol oxidase